MVTLLQNPPGLGGSRIGRIAQSAGFDEVGAWVSAEDLQPFSVENPDGRGAAVIVVDHASNRFPPPWGDLGLPPEAREAHIAWDPGALGVAREMSRRLDAPLVAATVSRLVVDLNRPIGSPTFAPALSETTEIPGNRDITAADMAERIRTVYEPYHAALDTVVTRQAARAAGPVAVVAVHTFTPVYRGVHRPLHVGILFDENDALGRGMIDVLASEPGLVVAENQPYSPANEVYFTLTRHAVSRGLPAAMIEIRNDEVREAAAEARWGARLAAAVADARAGLGRRSPLTRAGAATSRGAPGGAPPG